STLQHVGVHDHLESKETRMRTETRRGLSYPRHIGGKDTIGAPGVHNGAALPENPEQPELPGRPMRRLRKVRWHEPALGLGPRMRLAQLRHAARCVRSL